MSWAPLTPAANTNPTVTFQTASTNITNNAGPGYFSLQLYTLSGYANITNRLVSNFSTNVGGVTRTTNTYTNDVVTFAAIFTNSAATNLGFNTNGANGTNGLRFNPTNGILLGTNISTNFVLSLSQGGVLVVTTNKTWSVTNSWSNGVLKSSTSSPTNTSVFTNSVTNASNYLLVFQSNPVSAFGLAVFTNTNAATPAVSNTITWTPGFAFLAATSSYILPNTNTNGWTYTYDLVASNSPAPAYLTNGNQFVFTNGGILAVRYTLVPSANPSIWTPVTNTYYFVATNPAASGFDFVTDTNDPGGFTKTNLTYLESTPLVLSDVGTNGVTYSLSPRSSGELFVEKGITNVRALATNGTLVVTAVRPATATSAVTSNSLSIGLTGNLNPAFSFVTNTNSSPYTLTNLSYLQSTPLVLSNNGTNLVSFTLSPASLGTLFLTNNQTNLRANSGSGTLTLVATRAATATSIVTTATQTITLQKLTNGVTWAGVFSNTNSYIVTNPATMSLTLLASASNGVLNFSATSTPSASGFITNGNLLQLRQNGTIRLVANPTNVATNNYTNAPAVTNTVVVAWPIPSAPFFTSTNRLDGTQGVAFNYTLTATASNTSAFPVVFAATNLPPGLSFNNTNLISGTNLQPGLYRIQLTASNAGGVTTQVLTSVVAPASPFAVTNPWSNQVSLGTGTNTNGTYTFVSNLPAGIGSVTNMSTNAPPVLVLSNANPTPNGFAGSTNLPVVFSNSVTNFTSSVSLNVLPVAPVVSITSSATGLPGLLLSVTGTVSPTNLRGIPGYPFSLVASNLPAGLVLNPSSGVISGKPLYVGVRTSSLVASNPVGASTGNVVFQVAALAGSSLQMSVAWTNGVGTYSVVNLPLGLTLDPASGLVTGSPLAVGTFPLTVKFVPTGSSTTNTNSQTLTILPPAPLPRVPTNSFSAYVGRPFYLQPWVNGPGWGWSGSDPLTGTNFNTNFWTNQLLVASANVVLTSNAYGVLMPSTNGLTFTNSTNEATTTILWKSNLPVSWPWQALLRLRMPGSLTNGTANPFLGVFPAQTSNSTNYYNLNSEGDLLSSVSGVLPGASFSGSTLTNSNRLPTVGTNEITLRILYDTNLQSLTISANTNATNHAFTNFTALLTNTNLGGQWSLTNVGGALRIWLGGSFSNQAVLSNQIFLRNFAILPLGSGFTASNLPVGLECDPMTGTIYGSPSNRTSQLVTLYATNAQGTNFVSFQIRVE